MQDGLATQKAAVGSGPGAVAAELSAVGGSGDGTSAAPGFLHTRLRACMSLLLSPGHGLYA